MKLSQAEIIQKFQKTLPKHLGAWHLLSQTNFMDRLWNYHKDSNGNNGCEPLYWLFRLAFKIKFNYESETAP